MSRAELGQEIYEVFRHHMMRVTLNSTPRPHWHQLTDSERASWEKVAHHVERLMDESAA